MIEGLGRGMWFSRCRRGREGVGVGGRTFVSDEHVLQVAELITNNESVKRFFLRSPLFREIRYRRSTKFVLLVNKARMALFYLTPSSTPSSRS